MSNKKSFFILNLTGKLTHELEDYFYQKGMKVVDPLEADHEYAWTHVLTKNINDFSLIQNFYNLRERGIKIISLSKVSDLKHFISCGGDIILDDCWFNGPMGGFICDKYFQNTSGVKLTDNYPTFREKGSFKIVNPLNTGEYLDQVSHTAFDIGVDGLCVKSYFDHLIIYLSYLKLNGKAGIPFEVVYGNYSDIFAIQFHFYSKELDLEDLKLSLNSSLSKRPEKYALNIAIQSADFFDFSYLKEVSKAVITGLWMSDNKIEFKNRGLLINGLLNREAAVSYQKNGVAYLSEKNKGYSENFETIFAQNNVDFSEGISSKQESANVFNLDQLQSLPFSPKNENQNDLLQKLHSPQKVSFSSQKKSKEIPLSEISKVNISSDQNISDTDSVLVKGKKEDIGDTELSKVKGQKEDNGENDIARIEEGRDLAEPAQVVKGSFDTDETTKVVKGSQLDEDEDKIIVHGHHSEPDNMKVTLGGKDPAEDLNRIKGTSEQDIDEANLVRGQKDQKFSKNIIKNQADEVDDFVRIIKGKLEKDQSVMIVPGSKPDIKAIISRVVSLVDQVAAEKNIGAKDLVNSLPPKVKSAFYNYVVGLKKSIESLNDQDISHFGQQIVPEILKGHFQNDPPINVVSSQIDSTASADLKNKVISLEREKNQLVKELESQKKELHGLREIQKKMIFLEKQTDEIISETSIIPAVDNDIELKKKYSELLKEDKKLSKSDSMRLSGLLENESKLVDKLRKEEARIKKLAIDIAQKEARLLVDLEKANMNLKGKDQVIKKSKESLLKLAERKDNEIRELKSKLEMISFEKKNSNKEADDLLLHTITKENENLKKQLELQKAKITSLSDSYVKLKDDSHKDELRKMKQSYQQVKNKVEFLDRENQKLKSKTQLDFHTISQIREEKANLERLLKASNSEVRKNSEEASTNQSSTPVGALEVPDKELRRLQLQNQTLLTQNKEANSKISSLELKISDILKSQKNSNTQDDGPKSKLSQLETSLKKISQDLMASKNQLAESKKEANKLRQDKVALQNQMDRLKKDLEKSKTSATKKPGGKVA